MRALAPAILVLLLSGCLGAGMPGTRVNDNTRAFGDATVLGIVINDEIMPVEAARVVVLETGLAATTDAAGAFLIDGVPAGTWTLRVEEPRHVAIQESITVAPSESARVDLILPTIPGVSPHRSLFQFRGHYDCAHEVPIWPGDCMIVYEAATGTNDTTTNETFAFHLPVEQHWESVVLELDWEISAENQLDGMRLYLENGNGTETGHSYLVGAAEGPESPLRLVVHRGEPQERADLYEGTQQKAFIPDAGELAQVRVFPRGKFYDQTSQICSDSGCFLGIGAGLDVDFHVYATVFYVDRAPMSFSARPDA
jgi:hypothetical protein